MAFKALFARLLGRARRAPAQQSRSIASGTLNGVKWFNSRITSPFRSLANADTLVIPLGTSSMAPTRYRNVSATAIFCQDFVYLFDCGEGTQSRVRDCSVIRTGRIDRIFITHLHADHILGLPSVLSGILSDGKDLEDFWRNTDRPPSEGLDSESLRVAVYGPHGLYRFLTNAFATYSAKTLARMPIDVVELLPPGMAAPDPAVAMRKHGVGTLRYAPCAPDGTYDLHSNYRDAVGSGAPGGPVTSTAARTHQHQKHDVRAALLHHTVQCVGYVVAEQPRLRLNVRPLLAEGLVPDSGMRLLKHDLIAGKPFTAPSGRVFQPAELVTKSPGWKVVVMGDNSSAPCMVPLAQGAELVVHEATLPPGEEQRAVARGHSTSAMAGAFARAVSAKTLMLTHFGANHWSTFCMSDLEALGREKVASVVRALNLAEQLEACPQTGGERTHSRPPAQPQGGAASSGVPVPAAPTGGDGSGQGEGGAGDATHGGSAGTHQQPLHDGQRRGHDPKGAPRDGARDWRAAASPSASASASLPGSPKRGDKEVWSHPRDKWQPAGSRPRPSTNDPTGSSSFEPARAREGAVDRGAGRSLGGPPPPPDAPRDGAAVVPPSGGFAERFQTLHAADESPLPSSPSPHAPSTAAALLSVARSFRRPIPPPRHGYPMLAPSPHTGRGLSSSTVMDAEAVEGDGEGGSGVGGGGADGGGCGVNDNDDDDAGGLGGRSLRGDPSGNAQLWEAAHRSMLDGNVPGFRESLLGGILETDRVRMTLKADRSVVRVPYRSSPRANLESALSGKDRLGRHPSKMFAEAAVHLRDWSYPEVTEHKAMASLVRAAQDAFGSTRVIAARDFMAIPLMLAAEDDPKKKA